MRPRAAIAGAFVAAGVSLGASHAGAQVPDLVSVGGQYMPGVALEDPRPAEAQLASYDAVLNGPVPLSDASFLIPGVTYHAEAVSFAQAPPQLVQLRSFHALDLNLLSVQLLPDGWSLSLRVSAGLAGDFRAIDDAMVRLNALALVTHAFSDDFVLGGGGMVSYAFGSLLPLPALYVEWRPLPQLRVEAFLPAFAKIDVTVFDRLELGYEAQVQGNSYAIRDDRIAGAWPCAGDPARGAAMREACLDHIAYSVVTVGPRASVRLFSSVWWDLGAGHSVYRRFEPKNPDDEPLPDGIQQLPNAFYVRSGLTWRIPQ